MMTELYIFIIRNKYIIIIISYTNLFFYFKAL